MPASAKLLYGRALHALDGDIGHVTDLLFDDRKWTVRHLVVRTGNWLMGRSVLISPISIHSEIPQQDLKIAVRLTREEIEKSPDASADQQGFYDFYRWPYYWVGPEAWGIAPYPLGFPRPQDSIGSVPREAPDAALTADRKEDPSLRSVREVSGYRVQALDAVFGHVEDFLLDERAWTIRYLVIDTVNWWPSKSVLLSPEWIRSITWTDRRVSVDLDEATIKSAPEYDSAVPLTREYEERLHRHYRRRPYWPPDEDLRRAG